MELRCSEQWFLLSHYCYPIPQENLYAMDSRPPAHLESITPQNSKNNSNFNTLSLEKYCLANSVNRICQHNSRTVGHRIVRNAQSCGWVIAVLMHCGQGGIFQWQNVEVWIILAICGGSDSSFNISLVKRYYLALSDTSWIYGVIFEVLAKELALEMVLYCIFW